MSRDRFVDGVEFMTFTPGPATTARYRARIARLEDVETRKEGRRLLREGDLVQLEALLKTTGA